MSLGAMYSSKWISAVHAQWCVFSRPCNAEVSDFPCTRESYVLCLAVCYIWACCLPPRTVSTRLCVLYFMGDLKDFQG